MKTLPISCDSEKGKKIRRTKRFLRMSRVDKYNIVEYWISKKKDITYKIFLFFPSKYGLRCSLEESNYTNKEILLDIARRIAETYILQKQGMERFIKEKKKRK